MPATYATASIKAPEAEQDRKTRLRIKSRRRRYLELHPEYFTDPSLELADPLLYDRMIRQFQSSTEREADGRKKGYSGNLEADLSRSEAKLEALHHPDPYSPVTYRKDVRGIIYAVDQDEEDRPVTKAEGEQKWREHMSQRFLRGQDMDFDYGAIDGDSRFDDTAEMDVAAQDAYFDDQDEEFVGQGQLEGESGVQDF